MKLAEEIIESLSSEDSSLTGALLRTKVLLHKIGHKELIGWVNSELNGYSESDELPAYRVLPSQVLANMASIGMQATAHPVPLGHLTKEQREGFETAKMSQSLAVLEKLAEENKGQLQSPIPMEWNGLLGKGLAKGVHIQSAWCSISAANISSIFIQVRSRLLDFLLELNEKLPGDLGEEEIRRRSGVIDTPGMFKNAIFGDNVTIVMGTGNAPAVTNIQIKGDLTGLAENLRKHNVPEDEITNLQAAIQEDGEKVNKERKQFGPAVRMWIEKMLSKVADTSWQIEIGVASNLLTTALQGYYGWLR